MRMEKDLIRLEREVNSKMKMISQRKITPGDSGIGRQLNLIKKYDEALFTKMISEYKKILDRL
jgi:hypothetical protein